MKALVAYHANGASYLVGVVPDQFNFDHWLRNVARAACLLGIVRFEIQTYEPVEPPGNKTELPPTAH